MQSCCLLYYAGKKPKDADKEGEGKRNIIFKMW